LGKGKNDGWFVGFAPRRNPEIVVAAVVEDTSEHGGVASGPVVRDIVKAYYDKKNKKTPGQVTAGTVPQSTPKSDVKPAAATTKSVETPKVILKPEETAEVVPASEKKKDRP
jgi:hypothetical protein